MALSPEKLGEFIAFEDLKALDPRRIERIDRLLFPKAEPPSSDGNRHSSPAAVIRRHLFKVLKVQELDDTTPFQDYGLDSISAMVFTNRLSRELKREVPPEWVVGFPTVEALAAQLESSED
jgi:acyl carrier protein